MTTFSLEKLLDKVDNKYKISVIAAKRARVLIERGNLNLESRFEKVTSIAMEEVLNGKIKYDEPKKKSK